MKELQSPWNNWEGDTQTPGLEKLFSTFPTVLGTRGNGIDLENKVETANASDWIPHRIGILTEMGTEDLLRPLFCSTDMNLRSEGQNKSLTSLSGALLADQRWPAAASFFHPIDNGLYQQKLKAHKQQISDSETGQSLAPDTFFAFTFPERSHQDETFVNVLVQRQVLDEEFVKDVLAVDFTRPLYSKTRCDLLQFAPKLTPAQLSAKGQAAETIRTGFLTNLAGQSGAGGPADLAKNLSTKGDAAAHDAAVKAFFDACTKRPVDQFLEDVLGIAAHVTAQAKRVKGGNGQGIIEFQETLPQNDVPDSPVALDPVTCQRTLQ
jgi:hypothetical protein